MYMFFHLFLAHKVGLFSVHWFPMVLGLTKINFYLGSTVYISNQVFYAGVDPFDAFEKVSHKRSSLPFSKKL